MPRQEEFKATPEWRSKIESRFMEFVTRHVKPVEKTLRDASDIHEAMLEVDQLPSLIPVNRLTLSRMVIKETAENSRRSTPHPDAYTDYAVQLSHTKPFGSSFSIYFNHVDGFEFANPDAHTGLTPASHEEVWPIVRSLIEHESQERLSPIELE